MIVLYQKTLVKVNVIYSTSVRFLYEPTRVVISLSAVLLRMYKARP